MASPAIKKILVPLDGSAIAESIIPYAAGMAKASGAGIVLFQALVAGEDAEIVEGRLEDVAGDLRESGMGVATDVSSGDIAEEIVEAARRYTVGLIVMTGHASQHGRKDLLGSTAHSVLRRCATPVLIVPLSFNAFAWPAAIVVGHDGTENSQAVIDPAVALAKAISCELVLVRAVEPVTGLGGAAKYYGAVDDFAEEDLKQLRDEIASSGLKVSTHVGKRLPERELVSIADSRPGSIIAVSTSSLSTELNVLGSTTDRLVRSQTHPVLVVPES